MTQKAQTEAAKTSSTIVRKGDFIIVIGSTQPERISIPVAFKCHDCKHDIVAITTLAPKSLVNFTCRPCYVKKGLDIYKAKRQAIAAQLDPEMRALVAQVNAAAAQSAKSKVGMVS